MKQDQDSERGAQQEFAGIVKAAMRSLVMVDLHGMSFLVEESKRRLQACTALTTARHLHGRA